jgi:hypothetical protein
MPPLPMISLAPDTSNQRSSHLAKRKEAVAVTAVSLVRPSSSIAAAGEQWKFAWLSSASGRGRSSPSSSTRV